MFSCLKLNEEQIYYTHPPFFVFVHIQHQGCLDIFCFKNNASKEVWLKNNDQLTVGNWNKINDNQIEIKTDSSLRLYNIEEITNDTLRICESGTNNKINLTLS